MGLSRLKSPKLKRFRVKSTLKPWEITPNRRSRAKSRASHGYPTLSTQSNDFMTWHKQIRVASPAELIE